MKRMLLVPVAPSSNEMIITSGSYMHESSTSRTRRFLFRKLTSVVEYTDFICKVADEEAERARKTFQCLDGRIGV